LKVEAQPEAPGVAPVYPEDLRALVEDFLTELRFSEEHSIAGLDEAMRYSLLAGGKRIRPVLTLATASALGHDPTRVIPTAAAIELIHTYSLIHDDLPAMDDDHLRRGRPTCHVAFGENVAILAGDGLFAEAYKLVLHRQPGDPALVLSALREISEAIGVGGMVGGQYVDVAGAADLDSDGLRHMHELKTGRLIGASVAVAPILVGAPEEARLALGRFAGELGVLFQIVDDILDVTAPEEQTGKTSGSDERHGKRTYVSVFGLDKARALAGEAHARACRALAAAREFLSGDTRDLQHLTDFMYRRDA
jgi:geranylgeranyl diphosphate synthase, type II